MKTSRLLASLLFLLFLAVAPLAAVAQGGVWIVKASTPEQGYYGEAVVGTRTHIYVIRGWSTSFCQFWRYDPAGDSWTTLLEWNPTNGQSNVPPRPMSGTALSWDHGDYIYAIFGAYDTVPNRRYFYRYSISANSWERLTDTPHDQGAGDAIAWSGYDNTIYTILGSLQHGSVFARYNPSSGAWETLPFNPSWTPPLTDDGASLVWTGGEYLFALRGEWEETVPHNEFARYHVPSKTWTDMTPIPKIDGVADGASLIWVGDSIPDYSDYMFALGGGGAHDPANPDYEPGGYNFYRYRISSNDWVALESIPYPVGYYPGNRLGFANGHIYYWQGAPSTWDGGGKAFFMFSPPSLMIEKSDSQDPVEVGSEFTYTIDYSYVSRSAWVPRASTGTVGGYGEAVAGAGDYIYAIRCWSTGNCFFWRHDPAGDSWTTLLQWNPPADPPFNPIPRSKSGTALTWDHGDYIYALFGATRTETGRRYFYRYSISLNSWVRLADTTDPQGGGDALAWSGYDNMIYAMLGSRDRGTVFARYSPSGGAWETLPFNPSWTPAVTDDGSSLAWAGGEYVYALRGEWDDNVPDNDFARYHIVGGTWMDMTAVPKGSGVADGASLIWVGDSMPVYSDYIFALGGGNVTENPGYDFYRYRISSNDWVALESIPYPVGDYPGNRLGFASGHIYYWQGAQSGRPGGGTAFFMLSPPSPSVIEESYDPKVEFLSADPAPDLGTNNRWTLDIAGHSGRITMTVRVEPSAAGTIVNYVEMEVDGGALSASATEDTTISSGPAQPVGGILTTTDRFAILAPYLCPIGAIAFASAIFAVRRRRNP